MSEHEIEYRTAATLGVRHVERMIDMIAAPYEEPAQVFRRRLGKWVEEKFSRGAFAGVAGAVLVNRAHDRERPIGRVVKFHPNDPRGLLTEIRVAKTAEGDDLLELADEGLLAPSVGFSIPDGGEVWTENRSKVTIVRAALDHIAMTGDPAYTGAKVLAVRSASHVDEYVGELLDTAASRTPNLDRIMLERRAAAAGYV